MDHVGCSKTIGVLVYCKTGQRPQRQRQPGMRVGWCCHDDEGEWRFLLAHHRMAALVLPCGKIRFPPIVQGCLNVHAHLPAPILFCVCAATAASTSSAREPPVDRASCACALASVVYIDHRLGDRFRRSSVAPASPGTHAFTDTLDIVGGYRHAATPRRRLCTHDTCVREQSSTTFFC